MCSGSLPVSTSAACTRGGGGRGAGLGANGALDDDGGLEGGRCGGDRVVPAAPAAALGGFGDGPSFGGFGLDFGDGRSLDDSLEEECLADGLLLSIDLDASCAACCRAGWE